MGGMVAATRRFRSGCRRLETARRPMVDAAPSLVSFCWRVAFVTMAWLDALVFVLARLGLAIGRRHSERLLVCGLASCCSPPERMPGWGVFCTEDADFRTALHCVYGQRLAGFSADPFNAEVAEAQRSQRRIPMQVSGRGNFSVASAPCCIPRAYGFGDFFWRQEPDITSRNFCAFCGLCIERGASGGTDGSSKMETATTDEFAPSRCRGGLGRVGLGHGVRLTQCFWPR